MVLICVWDTGNPVQLKDGDIILFGSDSLLTLQLTPAITEHTTVEHFLRSECDLIIQRMRVRHSEFYN